MNVSRETSERLETYLSLLKHWNKAINLVSKASLNEAVSRHIQDSEQVLGFAPKIMTHWVDLGSGGGFPGLVCAIHAKQISPETKFTLIESDVRKGAFLRAVIRETGVNAKVLTVRIEDAPQQCADVLSARALARLPSLLGLAGRHLAPSGVALFPKGRSWADECADAKQTWRFDMVSHKSRTNKEAVILEIRNIETVSSHD